MNKTKFLKIAIDIFMTVILISLLKLSFTGLLLHEILGIALIIIFAYHIVLNAKWVKGVFNAILHGKANGKAKAMFALNTVLFILIIIMAVSSFLISREVLPNSFDINYILWANIHVYTAYALAICVLSHVLIHAKYLAIAFKQIFSQRKIAQRTCAVLTLCVVAFVGVRTFASNIFGSELSVQGTENNTSTQNQERNTQQAEQETQNAQQNNEQGEQESISENSEETQNTEPAQDEAEIQSPQEPTEAVPTLEEYLSGLTCTGCRKNCPLTALKCSKGDAYLQSATDEYNSLYSAAQSTAASTQQNENNITLTTNGVNYTLEFVKSQNMSELYL